MDREKTARAPVDALADVSEFLDAAQQLKSLMLWRAQLKDRDSGLLRSLDRQIDSMRVICEKQAQGSPRVAQMWRQALEEFAQVPS